MTRTTKFLLLALATCPACSEKQRSTADPAAMPDAGSTGPRAPGPPPISGGTLLITRDGLRAVAADPDTDRVTIVGIGKTPVLLAGVELDRGEEPGRLAEDGDGRVHVVLRRGGAVATIDISSGELLARRPVCVAPRGIAYDDDAKLLHVACASGALVSLSPLSGEVARRIGLDVDLRDVVVVPDGLLVSRFKSAGLIRLDRQGNVLARVEPAGIERGPQDLSELSNDPLESAVAWRTLSTDAGRVFMLHQYALARPIDLGTEASPAPAPYRAEEGSSCGGIVTPAVSALAPGGELEMGMPISAPALSVDVAASSDGEWLALAHAGATDDKVTIYRSAALPTLGRSPVRCAEREGRLIVEGQPVAVAMHPGRTPGAVTESDWLVVQTRNPSQLAFYSGFAAARTTIALEESGAGVGHLLFHRDAGSGIACAQCHPEGAEDGRIWKFTPIGERRTQAVNVGLQSTAPFHWDGDLANLEELVTDVFVHRMGLSKPSTSNLEYIVEWLLALRPPTPMVDPDSAPAVRGRAIFESAEVGCTQCHAGPNVATSSNFDVGSESPHPFQVPALRGVGYRAPFMHNGCAQTLRERFESPCGGGDKHGRTSQLSSAQIDDLVAYLKSL